MYGDPQVHPQPEYYWGNVNPVGPRGVYDEAKRFAEALTMAYRRTHGVDTAIVRIFNTFGPRMRPNDGRAIPTFIRQALNEEPITVAGDGSQTRSVCYVDDLVEGIVRLLHSDAARARSTSATRTRCPCSSSREWIRELTGSSRPRSCSSPGPQDDPTVRQPDITYARRELGWEPEIPWRTACAPRSTGSGRTRSCPGGGRRSPRAHPQPGDTHRPHWGAQGRCVCHPAPRRLTKPARSPPAWPVAEPGS